MCNMQRYNVRLKDRVVDVSKPTGSAVVIKVPYKDIDKEEYTDNKFVVYFLVNGKNIHICYSRDGIKGRDRTAENDRVWEDVYIITQLKENSFFNSAIIEHIANKFIEIVKSISNFECSNTVADESDVPISEFEVDNCREYVDEVYDMLYSIGLNFESDKLSNSEGDKSTTATKPTKPKAKESKAAKNEDVVIEENNEAASNKLTTKQDAEDLANMVKGTSAEKSFYDDAPEVENCFYLKKRMNDTDIDVEARMIIEDGKFVVLAGAKLSPVVAKSLENTIGKARREADIMNNVLMSDYIADTCMIASNFVTGTFSNGMLEWKDKDGNPLRDTLKKLSA